MPAPIPLASPTVFLAALCGFWLARADAHRQADTPEDNLRAARLCGAAKTAIRLLFERGEEVTLLLQARQAVVSKMGNTVHPSHFEEPSEMNFMALLFAGLSV